MCSAAISVRRFPSRRQSFLSAVLFDRRRKGLATAGDSPNAEDTFAKLLRAHASLRGTRPAFRLQDLGLWQTWTWAQVYEETRAIAQGLVWLGLKRSQTIAIVGANRPRLYWSITAAQMIGAIPVPVYVDAVAEEIAAVLDHSGAAITSPRIRSRSTRASRCIVQRWIEGAGTDSSAYGTHSMRRTQAAQIYRKTGNLRAVQLLLGHAKIESTVRYLGIEVDDALTLSEQVEL